MSHRAIGAVLAIGLAIGLAIWQPWSGSHLNTTGARTIVLFSIDTLRRDRVSAYAPEGAEPFVQTPHMAALAASGVLFTDARTPVPLTLPGHTTMLTGRPPAATGVRINTSGRFPDPDVRGFPLLQERLRAAGWHTAAFVSSGALARRYGLDQGFDAYDDDGLDDLTGLHVPERAGEKTIERALAHVRSRDPESALFLFVHIFEPHAPYASGSYDGEVAHADAVLGRFLEGLTAAGRPRAAILLTSDHGEALGALGESTHGILLGDAVLRVPFVLRAPGLPRGVRNDPADLADVAPTLAALAAIPWPATTGPGFGHDLLAGPVPADRPRVAESLYAYHRYGWAQLAAAVGPAGLLLDAGAGRALWLPAARWGTPQADPIPGASAPGIQQLNDILVEYKQLEARTLMRPGVGPGGAYYGGGTRVEPFLPGQQNARLPDPYRYVGNADLLDRCAYEIRRAALAEAVRDQIRILRRMTGPEADSQNPEVHFWLGEAHRKLLGRFGEADAAPRAEAAYARAWELGRRDEATLLLMCGVYVKDRQQAMLDRLEREVPQVGWSCPLRLLQARLLRALDRDEEAARACAAAEPLCRTEAHRASHAETCR